MITHDNQYEGFTTTERMTADKIVSFLDEFSFRIRKNTFVVFDNATYTETNGLRNSDQYGRRGVSLSSSFLHTPHI